MFKSKRLVLKNYENMKSDELEFYLVLSMISRSISRLKKMNTNQSSYKTRIAITLNLTSSSKSNNKKQNNYKFDFKRNRVLKIFWVKQTGQFEYLTSHKPQTMKMNISMKLAKSLRKNSLASVSRPKNNDEDKKENKRRT